MNSSLDLLHLAARAAERAGAYIRSESRKVGTTEYGGSSASDVPTFRPSDRPSDWIAKGHHDWATEVDRNAEAMIAEVLGTGAPDSRMVGEESSPELREEGLVWIVDPLDGTTNFLHGYPQYAVSIAAALNGRLEAAVVHDVNRECSYGALREKGAWLGDRRLGVSSIEDPARSLLGTGYPFKHLDQLERYLEQFRRILPATSGVRRAGSAALDLADVAAGRLDGFWELMLAPWDSSAGILLIREAGGRVTDLSGRDIGVEHTAVVAGNPAIHGWLLEQLGDPGIRESGDPGPAATLIP
ncbi:MAG TPA: inositol monophosphatase family protein [Gemmatimonadales bacterium]|nr:inositol monophosphatase family protein [Gemmatimonadales bacterium]